MSSGGARGGTGVRATWARSDVYQTSIALGPTQEAVYRYVWNMTAGGRRPEVTLARMAADLRKPVSSVHVALGRLRALGLIGVAARMGRTGGHRLWRVARKGALSVGLDVTRHKLAVARIIRRWYSARPARSLATTRTPVPSASTGPAVETPLPRPGPSFREAMHRAGFRRWWREDDDDGRRANDGHAQPDTGGDPDSRGTTPNLGLLVAPPAHGGHAESADNR